MQPLSADGASIPGTAKEVSFERCFEEHFVAIHRFIARRVGVPLAEDLAAETFATALRRLPVRQRQALVLSAVLGLSLIHISHTPISSSC